MSDFLDMGGYAAYVWSSYALTMVVLVANIAAAGMRERHAEKSLRNRLRRASRRLSR